MARRATVSKQERETNTGLILVLDGGSSLTGSWIANKSDGQVMVEAMNAMGYDGLALGRMDLGIGLDKILELEKQAKFPFLSANLVSKTDDKPLFKAYTTFERNGVKVGVIGLSEAEILQAPGVNNKAKLADAAKIVKQYVDELRPQVDLLVLLSHQGIDKDKELVQVVPGIDLVIGGNTRKLMREPEQVGNTLLMEQGYRGEWLGRFQVAYDVQGVPSGAKVDILSLDDKYADDPDIVEILGKWIKLYPSPTPPPTWTPDPNAPTPTPFPTAVQAKPTAAKQ